MALSSSNQRARCRPVWGRRGRVVLAVAIATVPRLVMAEVPPAVPAVASSAASHKLTLPAAVAGALGVAPQASAALAGVEAARAAVGSAALPPEWETTFTLENFAGGGPVSGIESAEATLELGRTLESGNKRAQRILAAQAAVGSAEAGYASNRAELAASVARRFLEVWSSQERIELLAGAAAAARQNIVTARQRMESGRSSEAELATARSVAAQADLDEALARSKLESGLRALQIVTGNADALLGLEWDGSLRDLDSLLPTLPAGPQKALAERREAEESLALARTQKSADWRLAAGVRRLEEVNTQALVFSVSRPLSASKRAEPAIAEAAANLRRARALEDAANTSSELDRTTLRDEIAAQRIVLRALETEILPQATRARDVYRRGYDLGRFSLIEVANAERELLTGRMRAIETRAALADARLAYRLLTGGWLDEVETADE